MSLLEWLEREGRWPKIYWQEKGGGQAWAGIGALTESNTIPSAPKERYFGGLCFSPSRPRDTLWRAFPSTYFFVPQELRQAGHFHNFHIRSGERGKVRSKRSYLNEEEIAELCPTKKIDLAKPQPAENRGNGENGRQAPLSFPTTRSPVCLGKSPIHFPPLDAWRTLVNGYSQDSSLEKIVYARRTTVELVKPLSVWGVLRRLSDLHATLFALQLTPQITFFGATPEMLYRRQGREIASEAVAGTRRRGATSLEDAALADSLLKGEKEQREFEIVKQWIYSTLKPLCTEVQGEGTTLLKTPSVQHLYSRITGTLKEKIDDRILLQELHPTPATGGMPRQEALAHLDAAEGFDRGWYGAPIGWIGPQGASFAVGIRSALLLGSTLHLFTGAGIVAGSDPDAEWQELEDKIRWIEQ